MKTRIIKLGLTAVALLLGQQALAHQSAPQAAQPMLCVEVVASTNMLPLAFGTTAEDKAALQARIKHDSLEALKQASNPAALLKQSRQALIVNGKPLQASL